MLRKSLPKWKAFSVSPRNLPIFAQIKVKFKNKDKKIKSISIFLVINACYNKYKQKKSILEGLNNERAYNNHPFRERKEDAKQAAHEAKYSPFADASSGVDFLHHFQICTYGWTGNRV